GGAHLLVNNTDVLLRATRSRLAPSPGQPNYWIQDGCSANHASVLPVDAPSHQGLHHRLRSDDPRSGECDVTKSAPTPRSCLTELYPLATRNRLPISALLQPISDIPKVSG